MAQSKATDLKVAVLLTFEAQLLDMSGIDLFGMMDKRYIAVGLPQPMVENAMDVEIFYIGKEFSSNESGVRLQSLTAQAVIQADMSVASKSVQPGEIDILLIPGPPPNMQQTQETLDFVRSHSTFGTTILTVCTGCNVAAQAGILDGRRASAPRALVPQMRKDFPQVVWDDSRRFVRDVTTVNGRQSELWTSGGVTNGLEMIAAYLREKFPGPVTEAVCAMADVGEKGEYYDTSVAVDNAWWIGQIFRAFFLGKRGPRPAKSS